MFLRCGTGAERNGLIAVYAMKIRTAGQKQFLLFADLRKPFDILIACERMPHFNSVQPKLCIFVNLIKIIEFAWMGKNGNAARGMDLIYNILYTGILCWRKDIGLTLFIKQGIIKIAEYLIRIACIHKGVHNMLFKKIGGAGSMADDKI